MSLTGHEYADGPSCIWNGGELPNWTEYEIAFPVTADYTLSALYAAADARRGRNDPCTCGSGRKFKRCHGAPGSGLGAPERP